jgi:hypothetical protein
MPPSMPSLARLAAPLLLACGAGLLASAFATRAEEPPRPPLPEIRFA